MQHINTVYTVKLVGPPYYYLGNYYNNESKGWWHIGCKKYMVEALSHFEIIFDTVIST